MSSIYSIKEITTAIKQAIEGTFPFVWVKGQVSNLSRPASGHLYFSLKDEEATLPAVWFKGQQQETESFDPLTGEVYEDGPRSGMASILANGVEVICAGHLTVYPPRGSYQLQVEIMQEAGKGRLQIEFERLKAELAGLGYFDPARKRKLPVYPERVAVITSPSGAAVQDFLRISSQRGLPAEIRIFPALVQGEAAPASIAAAFAEATAQGWAELVVLIRGGGSLEDLWAFNTRTVVDGVFNCPVPVLCGVGHEVDVSLSDLVADLRAATPSHAAQLLFKERRELIQMLDEAELALQRAESGHLYLWEQALALQEKSLTLLSPAGKLDNFNMRLAAGEKRLVSAMESSLQRLDLRLERAGDSARLLRSLKHIMGNAEAHLEQAATRLEGLDPGLPLERGYALVQKTDGSFLRSRAEAAAGDNLNIMLSDGNVPVQVT